MSDDLVPRTIRRPSKNHGFHRSDLHTLEKLREVKMPTLNPACLFVRFDCILISIVDLSISFFSEINENHQIINIKKLIVFVFTEHGRVKKKKINFFRLGLNIKTHLSNSVNLDESRKPLANGLLSIFNLVICKKKTNKH